MADITVGEFLAKVLSIPDSGVFVCGEGNIIDAARQNDKRPAFIAFMVPDDCVKNLNGFTGLKDWHFYVRVPREAGQALLSVVQPEVYTSLPEIDTVSADSVENVGSDHLPGEE